MRKRVGNYELGKTIGRGKYSKVKYCFDMLSKKTYAIKIMSLSEIKRGKMESQLRREIAIMKMINHKNVVRLYEVLQTCRNIYIVIELVTGGELFDKIMEKERFSEALGRKYFQELIDGLSYCQSLGIAHRDLKPENLLVDENENLKITDFGLSTLANQNQTNQLLTTTCGTPNYVAPEVISKKGYNGFKADIWSCGVILYVMLAGYLPFEDRNISKLFRKIEKGNFKTPKFFSKDLKDLISKMLTVNPEKRISIPEIRKHKWFRINYIDPVENGLKVKRKSGDGLPSLTKKDLLESISEVKKEVKDDIIKKRESTEVSSLEGLTGSRLGEGVDKDQPMNAFDLFSQFMMGSLSVLATGTKPPIITRNTRFMAKLSVEETKKEITEVLKKLEAHPKEKKNKENVLKCYYHGESNQLVTFNVILIKTIAKKVTFVEFERHRGASLIFVRLFRECMKSDRLKKIVAFETKKNEKINPEIKPYRPRKKSLIVMFNKIFGKGKK